MSNNEKIEYLFNLNEQGESYFMNNYIISDISAKGSEKAKTIQKKIKEKLNKNKKNKYYLNV